MARPKGSLLHTAAFRALLDAKGLTQKVIADRSGLSVQTISALCTQSTRASAPTAQAVASAVGCEAEALFPELSGQFAVSADLVPA